MAHFRNNTWQKVISVYPDATVHRNVHSECMAEENKLPLEEYQ